MSTATYVRLSQNRGHDEDKPERQRGPIANLLGSKPYEEYLDDDRSAYKGKPRKGWNRLQADIQAGLIDHVVALHMDRLLRDMRELESLVDLVEVTGCQITTIESGALDLTTSAGRQTARILAAISTGESERKAERHKSKAAQLRSQGKSQGGPRPFGWQSPEGARAPAEAELIASGTRALIEGGTLYGIRSAWAASGITTAMGHTWTNNKDVARVLARWRNAGLVEHDGQPVGPACWPAIVTQEEVAAVRQILSDPSRKSTPGPTRKHLLSGLATCSRCGSTLRKRKAGRSEGYYACSGPDCDLPSRLDAADRAVSSQVSLLFIFSDPASFAPDKTDRDRLVSLRSEKATIASESEELGRRVGEGVVPLSAATAAFQVFSARMTEIDRTLAVIATRIASADMLSEPARQGSHLSWERSSAIRAKFYSLSLDKKRAIIRQVFCSITVHPGRGSAEDRIEIVKRPRG